MVLEKWHHYTAKIKEVESIGLKNIVKMNTVFECAGVLKNSGRLKGCLLEHDPETLRKSFKGQGKYDEAEPLYKECLSKSMTIILGLDHPDTLNALKNLALLL